MKAVGYTCLNTLSQQPKNFTLAEQEKIIERYVASKKWTLDNLFLRARNSVMVKLPVLVIEHVRKLLKSGARVNAGPLREMLENASLLTRDRRLLDAISDLLNDPNL